MMEKPRVCNPDQHPQGAIANRFSRLHRDSVDRCWQYEMFIYFTQTQYRWARLTLARLRDLHLQGLRPLLVMLDDTLEKV